MATLEEVRKQYPQYADMSDIKLANALHRKFYKDIPLDKFYAQAGVKFEQEYNATDGMSVVDKTGAGVLRGMLNIGRNVGNIAGVVDDSTIADANALDADLLNTRSGAIGNFIGEAAAITPLTLGVGAGMGALGKGVNLASRVIGNPITRGAAEGAAQGFVASGPDNRLRGVAFGGVAGAALPAAGMALSKGARGMNRTPEAQLLLDRGVSLTPGQMNPKGMINQLEESLQSVPLAGSVIRGARENAEQQFNRAAIQEGAMAPLGSAAKTASGQLDDAFQSFGPAYAKGEGFPVGPKIVNQNSPDVSIDTALAGLAKRARAGLVPKERINETRVLRDQLGEIVQAARRKGGMTSDDLLSFRSTVRSGKRDFSGPGAKEAAMRALYDDADGIITKSLDSQLPPDAMGAVRAADTKYGTYKTLESAVSKARDRPGGFTGTMLSQAVKENTPEGVYARGGGGPLRDFASAASNTFEVRAPATGARLGVLGAGALGMFAEPTFGIPIAGGLLATVGTQTGRALAAGQTGIQKKLAAALAKPKAKLTPADRDLIARYARGLLVSPATTD